MHLDLRKASKLLREHITARVHDYPMYVNDGPGKDEAPIKQITAGYQFDQAGWIAIVVDTRPRAKADGKWNSYIEPNAIEFPDWHKAFNDLSEKALPVKVTLADGTKRTLGEDTTVEQFAECIGSTIRDVLINARDKNEFAGLPLASDCTYVVEEHDGRYGWSSRDEVSSTSEQAYLSQLEGDVSSKTEDGQVQHWIQVLDKVASGKGVESEWSFLAPDHAIKRLKSLGDGAIVTALKFVRKWASKPEFDGDRPKRNINELPMQTSAIAVLKLVCDSSCSTSEVESILREIVRRSVTANSGRKLWGIIPVWAARCLAQLFDNYPTPIQNDRTNELLNRDIYTKRR